MSPADLWIGRSGALIVLAALVGVLVRKRSHLWYAFALLLAIVGVHDSLVATAPDRFYRGAVWRAKETTLIMVRLAMVVELTIRIFRGFPGAMSTARRTLALILVGTFLAVSALPVRTTTHTDFVGELMPRVLNGTVWLFAALTVLILWYRLPIHWFQKAILLSYVPYLLVFTLALNALGDLGWQRAAWVNQLSAWAYVALGLFWTHTAWRRGPSVPDRR